MSRINPTSNENDGRCINANCTKETVLGKPRNTTSIEQSTTLNVQSGERLRDVCDSLVVIGEASEKQNSKAAKILSELRDANALVLRLKKEMEDLSCALVD